jgi:SAM-dependent methyltransferase
MLRDPATIRFKMRRSQYVLDQLEGSRKILDYGSGMGFLACYMAQTAEVVGVEIAEEWRNVSRALAEVFESTPRFVASDDDLEPGFDAVTMCNTVSHITHVGRVFSRVRDLLRPGGILFIDDNNNRQSVVVRRRQPKVWRSADRDYARERARFDSGREHETYGLGEEEILNWRGKDLTPLIRLREFAPRNPRNGSYHENWFSVHELEVMLFNAGFAPMSSRAKYVFDFKENRAASWMFRVFPRFSLYLAPALEVKAVRV